MVDDCIPLLVGHIRTAHMLRSAAAAQLAVEESVARAAEATERAAEARRRAEEAEALAATAKREAEARQETFRKCQGEAAEAEDAEYL
ncbi:rnf217 [Symbiodinium sp. CCMP2456]|nr:rnf217 [Symbiodinium sp. CCMP2456]